MLSDVFLMRADEGSSESARVSRKRGKRYPANSDEKGSNSRARSTPSGVGSGGKPRSDGVSRKPDALLILARIIGCVCFPESEMHHEEVDRVATGLV